MFLYFFGYGQQKKDSLYEDRPLKLEEVNFISGYYKQDGEHSAIMGGNGSERLSEISNTLDLKLVKQSNKYEHTINVGLTAEHRSSASTAYIDKSPEGATTTLNSLQTSATTMHSATSKASGNSGGYDASSSASALYGWRFNPSVNWTMKNLQTNTSFVFGGYFSY